MKKKARKLVLSRETLRPLDDPRGALGGGSAICTKTYNETNCGVCCSTAEDTARNCTGTCTANICSNTCETGGACTL
jgi:hypothetical protein